MQALTDNHQKSRHTRTRSAPQRGVSLIEVLIVLVILVVGISTVLRIFPSGFFSIESVSTAAVADSLGQAMIQAETQNVANLPDAIVPGKDLMTVTSQDAAYDPDVPDNLDNARNVENETVTVPTNALYAVQFGPITVPASVPLDSIQLSRYLTLNSSSWTPVAGDSTAVVGNDPVEPQRAILPGQNRFLVDLIHQRIAVPYAPYTPTGSTTAAGTEAANSYPQKMIVSIMASDGNTYTEYLYIPAGTARADNNPYAPYDTSNINFLADSTSNYQGGWFDPTTQYGDTSSVTPSAQTPPQTKIVDSAGNPLTWVSVSLYRPYHPVVTTGGFSQDPYEFTLVNSNQGTTDLNLGVIQFNPLAAGGNGVLPLTARISYQIYDWQIIHEDRDIPALSGGSQLIVRLTLKQLKRNGDTYTDTNPDGGLVSSQYTGLAGSGQDVLLLDLDTGKPVNLVAPLVDEDSQGTSSSTVSVGHSVGRLVVPGGSLGDFAAHRIRIFYQCQGDWTAAVQKAASNYTRDSASVTGNNDPLIGPAQFAFDSTNDVAYFPQSDAGKSVEFDGTYVVTNAGANPSPNSSTTPVPFSETVSIDPTLYPLGATSYVRVDLTDSLRLSSPIPPGAAVTFTAVRGLSSRAVVAWKENKHWKVHTVDLVLTRSQ